MPNTAVLDADGLAPYLSGAKAIDETWVAVTFEEGLCCVDAEVHHGVGTVDVVLL